jgi:hypothetical protein
VAFGTSTVSAFSGAVQDLFNAGSLKTKAAGNRIEAQEYGLASDLSRQNEQFTKTSTDIKEQQQQRQFEQTVGQQQADVASSGFTESGSALDILRDSASQGALAKETLGQQGLIEEAGYEEQAKSYTLMQSAANMAADADLKAASNSYITAGIKGAAAIASLFDPTGISAKLATSAVPVTAQAEE